jgi:hypothetical protein
MSIYNNFLNTFYKPYKNTIVFATLRNYCEDSDDLFVVYCQPICLPFSYLPTFIDGSACNNYKFYLPFRNKRIFDKKLNLAVVFNALKSYLHDNICADRRSPSIDIQKFFFPYYNNIVIKTVFWNVLTVDNVVDQMNLLYETTEPFTYENRDRWDKLIVKECCTQDLRIEINYDLYCPFFEYPIRFVFQFLFQVCN